MPSASEIISSKPDKLAGPSTHAIATEGRGCWEVSPGRPGTVGDAGMHVAPEQAYNQKPLCSATQAPTLQLHGQERVGSSAWGEGDWS